MDVCVFVFFFLLLFFRFVSFGQTNIMRATAWQFFSKLSYLCAMRRADFYFYFICWPTWRALTNVCRRHQLKTKFRCLCFKCEERLKFCAQSGFAATKHLTRQIQIQKCPRKIYQRNLARYCDIANNIKWRSAFPSVEWLIEFHATWYGMAAGNVAGARKRLLQKL